MSLAVDTSVNRVVESTDGDRIIQSEDYYRVIKESVGTVAIGGTKSDGNVVYLNASGLPVASDSFNYDSGSGDLGATSFNGVALVSGGDGLSYLANDGTYKAVSSGVTDFADLANKPTTIAGYGITDAYTTGEVDTLINSLAFTIGEEFLNLDTDAVSEGSTNLYHTTDRVQSIIDADTSLALVDGSRPFTGAVTITDATASISPSTGALIVDGGGGFGGALHASNFKTSTGETGGTGCVFIGSGAGAGSSGNNNYAIGEGALVGGNTGGANVAIGTASMFYKTSGSDNIALGLNAMRGNVAGSTAYENTALGTQVMANITSGFRNVGLGRRSLENLSTGSGNFGLGYLSLGDVTTGSSNVSIGTQALETITTHSGNVAIGSEAGRNVTGAANVFIGYQVGKSQTAINNTLWIHNSDATSTTALIYGEFDNALLRVNGRLEVTDTTASISSATGAAVFSGGAGFAKRSFFGEGLHSTSGRILALGSGSQIECVVDASNVRAFTADTSSVGLFTGMTLQSDGVDKWSIEKDTTDNFNLYDWVNGTNVIDVSATDKQLIFNNGTANGHRYDTIFRSYNAASFDVLTIKAIGGTVSHEDLVVEADFTVKNGSGGSNVLTQSTSGLFGLYSVAGYNSFFHNANTKNTYLDTDTQYAEGVIRINNTNANAGDRYASLGWYDDGTLKFDQYYYAGFWEVYNNNTFVSSIAVKESDDAITFGSTTASSSTTTGSGVFKGGVGIAKQLFVGGNLHASTLVDVASISNQAGTLSLVGNSAIDISFKDAFSNEIAWFDYSNGITLWRDTRIASTTASVDTTTGALIVSGGVGIAGAIYAGGAGHFTDYMSTSRTGGPATFYAYRTDGMAFGAGAGNSNAFFRFDDNGGIGIQAQPRADMELKNGSNTVEVLSLTSGILSTGTMNVGYTTASISTATGSGVFGGGVGIGGDIYGGGDLHLESGSANIAMHCTDFDGLYLYNSTGSDLLGRFIVVDESAGVEVVAFEAGSTGNDDVLFRIGIPGTGSGELEIAPEGPIGAHAGFTMLDRGGLHVLGVHESKLNPLQTDVYARVYSTKEATSISSAGLVVDSGVGIAKNLYVGGTRVNMANLPTSASGLATGDIWNDSGTLKVA